MKNEKYIESDDPSNNSTRKPFFEANNGGIATVDRKKIVFFGIIDIFTQYGYFIFIKLYFNINQFFINFKFSQFFKLFKITK